jgi:2-octaprenyl-6-methoxyphenol hydroxylase
MTDYRTIVAGAGPAGLAAAALLAKEGVKTALVAPASADDPRTVALMQPAIQLLRYLDVWPGTLESQTAPLRKLRMIDDTGAYFSAPTVDFDSHELNLDAFGWNFPLKYLLPTLRQRAIDMGVTMIDSTIAGATSDQTSVYVTLLNGDKLSAEVAIAADGANSILRTSAGISVDAWSYDQVAIATSFAHSITHDNISTEYHKAAGPFTTVPLPNGRSSLVWMERPQRADAIMGLGDRQLAAEIQIETHGSLGLIKDIGVRKAFPMKGLTARQFAKDRIILVGEAAHVVPPIGAQGLNMSLKDAAVAADLILAAKDAGSDEVMQEFNKSRRSEVMARQQVIDLMNKSLLLGLLPLEGSRAAGLAALHYIGPLKQFIMQHGLASSQDLPFAMRNAS